MRHSDEELADEASGAPSQPPLSLNGGQLYRTTPYWLITIGVPILFHPMRSWSDEPKEFVFWNVHLLAFLWYTAFEVGLRLRAGQRVVVWNNEILTLYQGESLVGSHLWQDLKRVFWVPTHHLKLKFQSGEEWTIPRQWCGFGSREQRAFRRQLLRHHAPAGLLLVDRENDRPSQHDAPPVTRIRTVGLAIIWIGGAVVLTRVDPSRSYGILEFALGVACLLPAAFFFVRDAWRRRNGTDRVVVTETGLNVHGRQILWEDIEALDWYGSNRESGRFKTRTGSVTVHFAAENDGPQLKRAVENHPHIQRIWRSQIALEQDLVLPGAMWQNLWPLSLVVAFLILGNPIGRPEAWLLFGFVALVLLGLTVHLALTPRLMRVTHDGLQFWPSRRRIAFEDITHVELANESSNLTLSVGKDTFPVSGESPLIGRIEAVLRDRISDEARPTIWKNPRVRRS